MNIKIPTLTKKARQSKSEITDQLTTLSTENMNITTPATCSHCGKKVMVMFDDLDNFNEFGCEQCYFDNDESNDLVWGGE